MKDYIKLHIIKHALQYYIKRPDGCQKDINQEKRVLEDETEYLEFIKEKYGIVLEKKEEIKTDKNSMCHRIRSGFELILEDEYKLLLDDCHTYSELDEKINILCKEFDFYEPLKDTIYTFMSKKLLRDKEKIFRT